MHYTFSIRTFRNGVQTGSGMSSVIADTPEEAVALVARRRVEYALRWADAKMETSDIGKGRWCECCRPTDQPNAAA